MPTSERDAAMLFPIDAGAQDPAKLAFQMCETGEQVSFAQLDARANQVAQLLRACGVAPGAVLPPPGKGLAYLHDAAGTVPLKCRVTPADVAQAVVALVHLETVTGQIVFVDGGQHLLGDGVGAKR